MGTGNTYQIIKIECAHLVHPRGHGEHFENMDDGPVEHGSSPWARGTHFLPQGNGLTHRFIPVGTGNTIVKPNAHSLLTVHPRGHGEHYRKFWVVVCQRGSSPWARGTLTTAVTPLLNARFIPVGTGNTSTLALWLQHCPVHPRGHGEHEENKHVYSRKHGSSPWARGTHSITLQPRLIYRFIPVGTGNTKVYANKALQLPVHPRGHGEH